MNVSLSILTCCAATILAAKAPAQSSPVEDTAELHWPSPESLAAEMEPPAAHPAMEELWNSPPVVPLPPALAYGLLGIGAVGLRVLRSRKQSKVRHF